MFPNGSGKLMLNKTQFDGEFCGGFKKQGIEETPEKVFKGSFLDEQYHGKGVLKTADQMFEGEFIKNEKIKGQIYYIKDGSFYEREV